jgi:5-methylcytosine-specific restriction endonuclease McrA
MKAAAVLLMAISLSADARIPRSQAAKHEFQREHACPSTGRHRGPCPGWQIDHRIPLKCGGPDMPENMQWLTVADHKAKTKQEAKLCPTRRKQLQRS